MRYFEDQNQKILFSNYPYNSLENDSFLSTKQTFYKNNKEQNYNPVNTFYKDKFSYYSSHSLYNLKQRHGTEFKIFGEEIGEVTCFFEQVKGHPKHTLISQFSFWVAAAIGSAQAGCSERPAWKCHRPSAQFQLAHR